MTPPAAAIPAPTLPLITPPDVVAFMRAPFNPEVTDSPPDRLMLPLGDRAVSYPLARFDPKDDMFSRIPTANRVTSSELPP